MRALSLRYPGGYSAGSSRLTDGAEALPPRPASELIRTAPQKTSSSWQNSPPIARGRSCRNTNLLIGSVLAGPIKYNAQTIVASSRVCVDTLSLDTRTGRHESLLITSVGTVMRCGLRSGLAMRLRTISTICLPNCSGNSRIVVSLGYSHPPIVSSQPATLMSSGIVKLLSRSAL